MNPRIVLIVLCISAIYLPFSDAGSGAKKGTPETCHSKHGWPRFKREGRPPGPMRDINFCRGYAKNTCCDRKQTAYIREILAGTQDSISPDCLMSLVDVQCAICNKDIGTSGEKKVQLCQSECQKLYDKCLDDYFAIDTITHTLRPCRSYDIVCSGLGETAVSPSEFVEHLGFECIEKSEGICFDESMKPSIEDTTTRTDRSSGEEKSGLDPSTLGMIVGMAMFVSGIAKFLVKQIKTQTSKSSKSQKRKAK